MPKANKVGKSRKTAAAAAAKATSMGAAERIHVPKQEKIAEDKTAAKIKAKTEAEDTALSRGQRRRQAKREQYLKKEKMIMSTLQLHKQDEQKKRIDGLDALKEALMGTIRDSDDKDSVKDKTEKEEKTIVIKSNKAKQNVVASELNRMGLVMKHPAFQSNPFEAMQEHLKNTLAKQGKQQQEASAKRAVEEKKAAEKRKQEKKERRKGKRHRSKFKATRTKTK